MPKPARPGSTSASVPSPDSEGGCASRFGSVIAESRLSLAEPSTGRKGNAGSDDQIDDDVRLYFVWLVSVSRSPPENREELKPKVYLSVVLASLRCVPGSHGRLQSGGARKTRGDVRGCAL